MWGNDISVMTMEVNYKSFSSIHKLFKTNMQKSENVLKNKK